MSKQKNILILLLVMLVLIGLTACEFEIDDSDFRADTEAMLNAVIADDFAACRSLVSADVDDASLAAAIEQMRTVLNGVSGYELQATNFSKNITNGVSRTTIRYQMSAGESTFYVDVTRVSGTDGLAGFYVTSYQEPTITGTIGAMADANAAQWVFLVVAVAELAFLIWMLVDCCCHKFKNKALWVALILVGNAMFTLLVADGQFRVNYNIGLIWNYTALIRYSTGGMMLRVFLPVGSVIYAAMRKKLHKIQDAPPAQPPMAQ